MVYIKRYEDYNNVDDFIEDSKLFIRKRIISLTMEEGISEYKLSKSIGKNNGYIQKLSSGKSLPSISTLIDICAFSKISLEEFFHADFEDTLSVDNIDNQIKELTNILKHLNSEELDALKHVAEQFLKNKSNVN